MIIPIIKKSDNVVINCIELEEGAAWTPPDDCYMGVEGGNVGDTEDRGVYTSPPKIVRVEDPAAITAREELAADLDAITDPAVERILRRQYGS